MVHMRNTPWKSTKVPLSTDVRTRTQQHVQVQPVSCLNVSSTQHTTRTGWACDLSQCIVYTTHNTYRFSLWAVSMYRLHNKNHMLLTTGHFTAAATADSVVPLHCNLITLQTHKYHRCTITSVSRCPLCSCWQHQSYTSFHCLSLYSGLS